MRHFFTLAVVFLFLSFPAAGAKEGECASEGEVITIDRYNFHKLVRPRKDKWLLFFHAPWCAECKELENTYVKEVAKQGAGKFFVGSINGGEDVWLRTSFGLRKYPTFKVCHKERMYTYQGRIDEEYLFEFADETFPKYPSEVFPQDR